MSTLYCIIFSFGIISLLFGHSCAFFLFPTSLNSLARSATTDQKGFTSVPTSLETDCTIRGNFSGIERIIITASGNLQRILSAYFNEPITVKVHKSKRISEREFDREVSLNLQNRKICNITGTILVNSPDYISAISDGRIGVGQLLSHYNLQPNLKLLSVSKTENESLIRLYELYCDHIRCRFREEFEPNFLEMMK